MQGDPPFAQRFKRSGLAGWHGGIVCATPPGANLVLPNAIEPMSTGRLLLPLTIPLGVLVVGLWTLSAEQPVRLRPQRHTPPQPQRPAYGTPPVVSGHGLTCRNDPGIAEALLLQAQRIGVAVRAGSPELPGKDASYRAEHGRLGTITLKQRPMSAEVRCLLISHELIHVLQHLHGGLKGVPPLGWGTSSEQLHRFGSAQEAEAYAHQNDAGHVLMLLQATPRMTPNHF